MATWRGILFVLPRGWLAAMILMTALPAVSMDLPVLPARFSLFWLNSKTEPSDFLDVPSLAIDPNNGQHVVFFPRAELCWTGCNIGSGAYYGYCPGNCASSANWSYVHLGEAGIDFFGLAIALTPEGHPRVAGYYISGSGTDNLKYYFAECDNNCGQPANWISGEIYAGRGSSEEPANHFLSVDSSGTAHIFYIDKYLGSVYASCESNCTLPTSWTEVSTPGTGSMKPVDFMVDSAGYPRLVFMYNRDVFYMECNANCGEASNWEKVLLRTINGDYFMETFFALDLTSAGKPRVAIYSDYTKTLDYGRCNTGCTTLANWSFTNLGLPVYAGVEVDIELDSQDRPYLSYQGSQGLYYSACTDGCETGTPVWSTQVIETISQLEAREPVPFEGHDCTPNSWNTGFRSSIALDGRNNPYIVSVAKNRSTCIIYNGQFFHVYPIVIVKGVRYATAELNKPMYLPAVENHQ